MDIGREVIIVGQAAVIDHVKIGDRATIGGKSGVIKSVSPGDVVSGFPSIPHSLWLKTRKLISRLPELNERIRQLEKKLELLEEHREEP